MNREYYYFSSRLTGKLNMIRRKPLTIVCAHKAAGKSTAVKAYLQRQNGCVIWQAVSGSAFQSWLADFLSMIEMINPKILCGTDGQEKQSILTSEDPACRIATLLKKSALEQPIFM